MRALLDTHLLLWAALKPQVLSKRAAEIMGGTGNDLAFSVVSVWEVVIKLGRGRRDFQIDPQRFRSNLLASGYREIEVTAPHVLAVRDLPLLHADPFDRLLVAQARVEDLTLMTADAVVARYSAAILKV